MTSLDRDRPNPLSTATTIPLPPPSRTVDLTYSLQVTDRANQVPVGAQGQARRGQQNLNTQPCGDALPVPGYPTSSHANSLPILLLVPIQ